MNKTLLSSLIALASFSSQAITISFENVMKDIPDDNALGIYDTHNIASGLAPIRDLNVFLNISGDFNGDLYAILVHENDSYAVLLNRVGRSLADPFGSSSAGFNVKFDDQALIDIHLAGISSGILADTFQPDGRETDPSRTLATDDRTTSLSGFNGIDPTGAWTLLLADLSPDGTSRLDSWSLEFNNESLISTVPETGNVAWLGFSSILLLHIISDRKRLHFDWRKPPIRL